MSAWWSSLAERERRLLLLAAAVLATGLFYGLLWAPLQRGVALRSQRVAALRADLAWMRGAAVQLVSLRAQAAPPAAGAAVASDAPLARQVADSARAAGLSTVIELPAGAARGPLQIALRPVSFATLMPWLAGLRGQGVVVDALQLDAAGAGRVQGQVTLDRIPAGDGASGGGSD